MEDGAEPPQNFEQAAESAQQMEHSTESAHPMDQSIDSAQHLQNTTDLSQHLENSTNSAQHLENSTDSVQHLENSVDSVQEIERSSSEASFFTANTKLLTSSSSTCYYDFSEDSLPSSYNSAGKSFIIPNSRNHDSDNGDHDICGRLANQRVTLSDSEIIGPRGSTDDVESRTPELENSGRYRRVLRPHRSYVTKGLINPGFSLSSRSLPPEFDITAVQESKGDVMKGGGDGDGFKKRGKEKGDDDEDTILSSISEEESGGILSMERIKRMAVTCLAIVTLTSQISLSAMLPLFPPQAAKQGVTSTTIGWIFGVFPFLQLAIFPVSLKLLRLSCVQSRFVLAAGQLLSATSIILFGFIDYIRIQNEDTTQFVIICFFLRICFAIGYSASAAASCDVIRLQFFHDPWPTFNLLQTAGGVGAMLGPVTAGILFDIGGFVITFAILGGFLVLTVPLSIICIPMKNVTENQCEVSVDISVLDILRINSIVVVCVSVLVTSTMWSLIETTLALHLLPFKLNPAVAGLLFLLVYFFYFLFAPVFRWTSQRLINSSWMMAVGFIFLGTSVFMIGHSSIAGQEKNNPGSLHLNVAALISLGICLGIVLVPTLDRMISELEKAELLSSSEFLSSSSSKCDGGNESSFIVFSLIAGLWLGSFTLGQFVGPSFGGMFVNALGFDWTMISAACACAFTAGLIVALNIIDRCQRKKHYTELSSPVYSSMTSLNQTTEYPDSTTPVRSEKIPLLFRSVHSAQYPLP